MNVLVTGATGFLGRHLVQRLVERGDDVRALVRPHTDAAWLEEDGVRVHRGSLTDPTAVRRASAECELAFHAAGLVSYEHADLARLRDANVATLRAVLDGVEREARLVHVSSLAAVGPSSSPDRLATEGQPFPPVAESIPYSMTKLEAERLALAAVAEGRDVVMANPSVAFGPGDVYRSSTWPVFRYLSGRLRVYVDGGTANNVPGLIPSSASPVIAFRPQARLPYAVLDEFTDRPTRTARTYCCFVENSGNGDVVVTVLVRAETVGDVLYVEGRSQVLLPVQAGFKDVYWVSPNPDQASMPVARAALPRTTGLWLESPIRLVKCWLEDRHDERNLREEGLKVERGQPVNYGSSSSLREDAALPSDPGFYGAMDQVVYSRVMTQQIFDSLAELLALRGVTSPDLEEQRRLLVEQTFNVEGIRNAAPHGTENRALR